LLDKLKADFDGILELVQKVPEPLRESALKLILEQWFALNAAPPRPPQAPPPAPGSAGGSSPSDPIPVLDTVRTFVNANGLTTGMLEKVFHPLGSGAQLLATEIEGNGKSGKVANLAVLLAVRQALESGSFVCTLKELREMAVHYDCYDSTNFSKSFQTYKSYFKPRAKGADLELSGPGLKKGAELIKAADA
jgi:hypothetical protein